MARGSKAKYTNKQKRQARHIEKSYVARGLPDDEAEARAWATVNKQDGGGKKSGSGRGKKVNQAPARKGARRPAATRSASAKKAARTRAQRAKRRATSKAK